MLIKDKIIREIEHLPNDLLKEVYDFICFIEMKNERELLARSAQSLSEKSFQKVWDNDEDSIYDQL